MKVYMFLKEVCYKMLQKDQRLRKGILKINYTMTWMKAAGTNPLRE
jgi:hypothetical protein